MKRLKKGHNMKIQIPKFLQNEFEEYIKTNQNSPIKSDRGQERLNKLLNRIYGAMYLKIVQYNQNYPQHISIKYFRKITTNDRYIYFILKFFDEKKYIVPIRTKNGNKSYSPGGKGSAYYFTDQFLNKIKNSECIEDKQSELFIIEQEKQYKSEVEAESEQKLKELYNQKQIQVVKQSMQNLKHLHFVPDRTDKEIAYTKNLYESNIIKFDYRIYSPFSKTNKHYIECGWVVDDEGEEIKELRDWHASGFQMLQMINAKHNQNVEEENKWIEGLLQDKDGLYIRVSKLCGWNYGKEYMKRNCQWFINSNPKYKQEFIANGVCEGLNRVQNEILKLFYEHTPKMFKMLADYETYIDHGKEKSAIWKEIFYYETICRSALETKFEFRTYGKHDSISCAAKYCTEENREKFDREWMNMKYGKIFKQQPKPVTKQVEQHEIFNQDEHLTVDKLYDYYENYYYTGKANVDKLTNNEQMIWRKFNTIFNSVWSNVDCGNILEGRKLIGEDWMSRRDKAEETIKNTISKTIKWLEKIQTECGNEIFKHIVLTLFQSGQKQVLFYNKGE